MVFLVSMCVWHCGLILVFSQFSAFPFALATTSTSVRAVCCLPRVGYGQFLAMQGSSPGSLFCFADGHPLTRQLLSSMVQSLPRSVGYSGSYSGHSFWIGAATTVASQGLPDDLTRTFDLWFSDTHLLYLHIS